MRYLVISDIHGNLQALDAVIADAQRTSHDAVLCLGDLVGYGADPNAVIDKTLALKPAAIIRGNHDKVCAGLEPPILFNEVAKRSVEWTRKALSETNRETLAELPKGPVRVTPDLEICHGATFDEDHYVFDSTDAMRSMEHATARICLFGHTHLPAIYTSTDDPVTTDESLEENELRLPKAGPALINVGSVGQPRDGNPDAAYGILDLARQTIQLCRVAYDIKGAQTAIMKAGLPNWLAVRLERGQ